eukprot:10283035-Karenia_brevis.AAC.1
MMMITGISDKEGKVIASKPDDILGALRAGWSEVFRAKPIVQHHVDDLLGSIPHMERWNWSGIGPPNRSVYKHVMQSLVDSGPGLT